MNLPTWAELSSEEHQLEVLEYPLDKSLFVVGPPGSGKTVLAVQRAKMMVELKTNQPVVMITYNRMLRRSISLLSENNLTANTMHKFVSNDYKNRTGDNVPQLEPYVYNWELILKSIQNNSSNYIKSHMIVDEGQDLPYGFFTYASRYASQTLTVFADEDQALNDQRTTLEDIKNATGLDNPIMLQNNHRNTPEIALLAEHFHNGRVPTATVTRNSSGNTPRLIRKPDLESTADLVSRWSENSGGSIGVIVDQNNTGENFHKMILDKLKSTRIDIYNSKKQNEDSIDVSKPGVTIVNKESVKGQEFDTAFILEIESFIPCTNSTEYRAMYMMCTRARDNLFLVYGPNALSAEAMNALPEPDIIERA